MVLVMDVARYKYPPVWVRTEDLFNAIHTHNIEVVNHVRTEGKYRGYTTVECGYKIDNF